MVYYTVIGSGSKGNATFLCDETTAFFIDQGFAGAEIEERMQHSPLNHHQAQAILVTHNHGDHIKGVGVMARFLNIPVYTNELTHIAMKRFVGKRVHYKSITPNTPFTLGSFTITPFAVSHDTVAPMGYLIEKGKFKLGYCTDLGVVQQSTIELLRGCTDLIVEFNHDTQMLKEGPYPPILQERVDGNEGHLSNEQAETLVKELASPMLKNLTLIHLSEKNNTPEKAMFHAQRSVAGFNVSVIQSFQDKPTEPIVAPC